MGADVIGIAYEASILGKADEHLTQDEVLHLREVLSPRKIKPMADIQALQNALHGKHAWSLRCAVEAACVALLDELFFQNSWADTKTTKCLS